MTDPELRRIVKAQGRLGIGIPVLLFSDDTLAGPETAPAVEGRVDDQEDSVVRRAAEELGYDLEGMELFSTEAYLLQTRAGQLWVGP